MLLEQYIERLEEISPDYPDVKDSLDKVALAANKANDNITKLVLNVVFDFLNFILSVLLHAGFCHSDENMHDRESQKRNIL